MLYLEKCGCFSGSMTELSSKLIDVVSDEIYKVSNKIKNPIQLSKRLGELESGLSAVGIHVEIGKKSGKRYVTVSKRTLEGRKKTIKKSSGKKKNV